MMQTDFDIFIIGGGITTCRKLAENALEKLTPVVIPRSLTATSWS